MRFDLEYDEMQFADEISVSAPVRMVIESDADGSYFQLVGLESDGKRQDGTGWFWLAVAEWISIDIAKPIGRSAVRNAHAEAPEFNVDARADDRAEWRLQFLPAAE